MNKENDKIFEDLQQYLLEEASEIFSEKVVSLAYEPINVGSLENHDGHGRITGSCGDTMEIYIKMKDGKIDIIKFQADGCGVTMACGSAVTELAKGKTLSGAESIGVLDVLTYLDNLPASHDHCALLAVNTLQKALKGLKI